MICGVLVDSASNRAILDTAQGYLLFDFTTKSFSPFIPALTAENFALNRTTRTVLAPTYGVGNFTGLQLIDLANNNSIANSSMPLGSFPDSVGIDLSTNILVIPDEFTGDQYLVNMANVSVDSSTRPPGFSAPTAVFPINFTDCGGELHDWSDVSVEGSTHILFLGTEFADCSGVETLPNAIVSGAPPTPVIFHWGHVPAAPDGIAWNNGGGPHGIAVFTSVLNGKPYGFLIRGDQAWIARVDLSGVRDTQTLTTGLFWRS